jgi:hypothetical protein
LLKRRLLAVADDTESTFGCVLRERRRVVASRQTNDERRALTGAGARRAYGSSVQLDELFRNGEAEPQAAMPTAGAAVGLPEWFENEWQELG